MEELTAIKTADGREFKPWASREDVQAIEQAVEQAVQDPGSITAITSEIASGKQAIASAINAKGGSASATESFSELAEDIEDMSQTLINQGLETTEPINFLKFLCSNTPSDRVNLIAIDDNAVETINVASAFVGCNALKIVKMSSLTTITADGIFAGCTSLRSVSFNSLVTLASSSTFADCSSLRDISMPNLRAISGSNQWIRGTNEEFYFPALEEIYAGGAFANNSHLLRVILPSVRIVNAGSLMYNSGNIQQLEFGSLTTFTANSFNSQMNKLRNITIGVGTNIDLPFQQWTATNVIAEGQSGIDELNSNLQTNLIAKLYQGGGKILRLGAALYDVTTQETRDMVTAKGWTLQRG